MDRDRSDTLRFYLAKYLILYFDSSFDPGRLWEDRVRDFRWRHPFYRRKGSLALLSADEKEACKCLGISPEEFPGMDRRHLIRCYRQLAKETHPDREEKRRRSCG